MGFSSLCSADREVAAETQRFLYGRVGAQQRRGRTPLRKRLVSLSDCHYGSHSMHFHCAHFCSGFLRLSLTTGRRIENHQISFLRPRCRFLQQQESKSPQRSRQKELLYSLWSLGCSSFLDKTFSFQFHLENRDFRLDIPSVWMLQRASPGWELQGMVAPLSVRCKVLRRAL